MTSSSEGDDFYESDEFEEHSKLMKHDIWYEYLIKYSADNELTDKDYDIKFVEKFQIKKYTYDIQTEKGKETDERRLYYCRLPEYELSVTGIKPKNAYGYEYSEENVANENETQKGPTKECNKLRAICVGFILDDTKRIVVS